MKGIKIFKNKTKINKTKIYLRIQGKQSPQGRSRLPLRKEGGETKEQKLRGHNGRGDIQGQDQRSAECWYNRAWMVRLALQILLKRCHKSL